jgi:hypothetical protein
MGRSEIACARCGRSTPVDQLSVWRQDEQHRVFHGPPQSPRSADALEASPRPGVYSRVRKHCAYLTCEPCFAQLRGGGGLDDLHNRKVALYAAAVFALGVLIMIMTPVVMPGLLIAFWRW